MGGWESYNRDIAVKSYVIPKRKGWRRLEKERIKPALSSVEKRGNIHKTIVVDWIWWE
jgi:hypothetical protein